jgi:SOS-response transcriptional repressor LexA
VADNVQIKVQNVNDPPLCALARASPNLLWQPNHTMTQASIIGRYEPITQTECVEVPKSMMGRGDTFALRVKGDSMLDESILPGDVVVVQKQSTAQNGQTALALLNGEAT